MFTIVCFENVMYFKLRQNKHHLFHLILFYPQSVHIAKHLALNYFLHIGQLSVLAHCWSIPGEWGRAG